MAQRDTGQPQFIQQIAVPGDNAAWGGLNRYDLFSRYTINDVDSDEFLNWLPMSNSIRQVPGNNPTLATLAATAIWMSAQTLNLAQYLFCLCTNGHLYQVSLGGAITDVSGATSLSALSDITNWQGTTIIISDVNAAKVYSWNGTTFATVFTAQPVSVMAVYGARLWMANQNTITFTAGGTFNSLGGDAGSFIITDSTCQPPITCLYPFAGLLFIFGYDWIQTLGNVVSIGNPAVTIFQISTIETRVGTSTRWSVLGLGSTLFFANLNGIWELQGSFPTKISKKIDGFWQNLTLNASSLSVAYGYIYNEPCLLWQAKVSSDSQTTVFGMTQEGVWFRTILGNEGFLASDIDQTTGNSKVFGVSGASVFQMYANPTAQVTSTLIPKFWSLGSMVVLKRSYKIGVMMMVTSAIQVDLYTLDNNGNVLNQATEVGYNFSNTVTFVDSSSVPITWRNAANTANVTWTAASVNQFQPLEWNIDNFDRFIASKLVVVGSGNIVTSMNVEMENSQARWGP